MGVHPLGRLQAPLHRLSTDIYVRIRQHRNETFPDCFTARYNIKCLVHLEAYGEIHDAIAREKQLKRWSRIKKIQLIVRDNPDWRDLSLDWEKQPVWDGKLNPPQTF